MRREPMDKRALGSWGEDRAARFLRRKGYRIVERNFSTRLGEIDIIAEKGGIVAFVEVKLRKNADYGEAKEFVTYSKQRKVISTAMLWLARENTELQPRFDVIEIYAPDGVESKRVLINHIEDAFQ